jgi:hypothetical protein
MKVWIFRIKHKGLHSQSSKHKKRIQSPTQKIQQIPKAPVETLQLNHQWG